MNKVSRVFYTSLGVFIWCACLDAGAAEPSFDCAKARTQVEKAICASPSASALDKQLGDIYTTSLLRLKGAERQLFKETQRGWMKWRNEAYQDCTSNGFPSNKSACLDQIYQERIAFLEGVPFSRANECPVSQRIQINLAEWMTRMRNATDGDTLVRGLAEMRLMGIDTTARSDIEVFGMRFVPKKIYLNDYAAPLTPDGKQHVLRMTAESASVDEARRWFSFAKVIEPIGTDLWCDVGAVFSEPDLLRFDCPQPQGTLAFEHMTDTRSVAIHTTTESELCNPGGRDQWTGKTTAYWIQVGWNLRRIFQQTLKGSSYNVMSGSVETKSTVKLSDGLPKTIAVTIDETCTPGMAVGNFCNSSDDEADGLEGPARPGYKAHQRYVYVYAGGTYVATPKR